MPDGVDHDFAIAALQRCVLFARADVETLDACAAQLRMRRFKRGETIFHQGDPGDSLFIIEEGSVKIVLPSPEGEEAAIIATLARGDFFGELALLDGAYRSATAVAVESTSTLVLRREPLVQLVDADTGLRNALLAGLAAELRRLTGHVEELHFLDLPGRLASRLRPAGASSSPGDRGEVRLPWPYTQSELAGDDRRHAPDGEPPAEPTSWSATSSGSRRRRSSSRTSSDSRARPSGDPGADRSVSPTRAGRAAAEPTPRRSRRCRRRVPGRDRPAPGARDRRGRPALGRRGRPSPCSTRRRRRSPSTTPTDGPAGVPGGGR